MPNQMQYNSVDDDLLENTRVKSPFSGINNLNYNKENLHQTVQLHNIKSMFDAELSESLDSESESCSKSLSQLNADENPYNSDAGIKKMIRSNLRRGQEEDVEMQEEDN